MGRLVVVLLVAFPYLLFRFTTAFRVTGHRLANGLGLVTAAMILWTLALPRIPQQGEARPDWFVAYLVAFAVYWLLLSLASAVRLWRAGTTQPSVARRRTRLLAVGTAVLTAAVILATIANETHSRLALAAQALASVSVLLFLVVFEPPRLLRLLWRTSEQVRLQEAIASLLTFAESQEEMAARVLEPAAHIVGARGMAMRNGDGRILASWDTSEEAWPEPWPEAELVELDVPGGTLIVWPSPYAPFFGDEELSLLRTLGDLMGLAFDRVRSFQVEHEARLALERANELKTNFIALAAHELRTPMTTIHGFVTTLYHLADRLEHDQRESVRKALLQQTERMARLIEQLLDLSRLDADAIRIRPEPLRVRPQLEEIVAAAAPETAAVELDVDDDIVALVDRNALDRIVSNLVTNALRYGQPPVIVRAAQSNRHFRLSVEDRGNGVGADFVPDLFDRFTRAEATRTEPAGSGLGLAIARSYARAHGGDLLYEDATPQGACFRLVLPSLAPAPEVVASRA